MAQSDSSRTLLEPHELAELGPPEAVRLPLELIDANPNNPRRDLAEVDLLAENIRTFGLLQPIIVRRVGGRYELLGGHRRRAAFQMVLLTVGRSSGERGKVRHLISCVPTF